MARRPGLETRVPTLDGFGEPRAVDSRADRADDVLEVLSRIRPVPPPVGGFPHRSGDEMGIYDRDYYHRGEGGGPAWFGGVAPWCKTIILINAVVFLAERAFHVSPDFMLDWLAASPEGIFEHGRVWQLLTATFLHDGIWHILGNMWFLWIVGREMESLYGSRDFLAFYISAAIVSTLCWAVARTLGPGGGYMVGASGAVTAVLALYTLYYPKREIYLLFIPMPMWVVLALFLAWPIMGGGGGRIAYESHLAGAAFAYLFKRYDLRWSRVAPGRLARPRLKIVFPSSHDQSRTRAAGGYGRTSGEVGGKGPRVSVVAEEQLDAQLDEILAKIAREGRESLTEDEKRVLEEASQRARDRRGDRR